MRNKDKHFHIRASEKDIQRIDMLARALCVSRSRAAWLAIRFALDQLKMFRLWLRNCGPEDDAN